VGVSVCAKVGVMVGVLDGVGVKDGRGVGVDASTDPGADRFRVALSSTRTQSSFVEGVKFLVPVVGYDPMSCAVPLRGLNHQAMADDPEIFVISKVICFWDGIYAMTVEPSEVRAAPT